MQKSDIPQKSDTNTQQIIGIIWKFSKSVIKNTPSQQTHTD